MSAQATIEIRSYGVCFKLERRIHKLDRWRIPVPYGVPLRGIAYFGAALLAMLILSRLPLVGRLLHDLNAVIRYGALPVVAAGGLLRWNVDGRFAHRALLAWLRFAVEPRRLIAFRTTRHEAEATVAEVAIAPDERSARLRRGVVEGPATVLVRYPIIARPRGRTLHVRRQEGPALWRGKQVELRPGQRMVLR
jgi:hypothetical protein